jgi:hypothetical protein
MIREDLKSPIAVHKFSKFWRNSVDRYHNSLKLGIRSGTCGRNERLGSIRFDASQLISHCCIGFPRF